MQILNCISSTLAFLPRENVKNKSLSRQSSLPRRQKDILAIWVW